MFSVIHIVENSLAGLGQPQLVAGQILDELLVILLGQVGLQRLVLLGLLLQLSLQRGLLLRGGDVLSNEEGTEFVQVIAADEGVSVVRCDDPFMLAKACYHLGNRHVPLQIMPGELRYHHDHVLDDMLRQFGLTVTFGQLPFEPEAGAYASESHGHHHAHHDHHAHSH